jgi:hypothetical protein
MAIWVTTCSAAKFYAEAQAPEWMVKQRNRLAIPAENDEKSES